MVVGLVVGVLGFERLGGMGLMLVKVVFFDAHRTNDLTKGNMLGKERGNNTTTTQHNTTTPQGRVEPKGKRTTKPKREVVALLCFANPKPKLKAKPTTNQHKKKKKQ